MKTALSDPHISRRSFPAAPYPVAPVATGSEASVQPVVMVVDDSPMTRKIHSVRLERQGCQVMQAASGLAALAQLHRRIPDLILLDVVMPNFDGLATCRTIKADRWSRDVPVVMLSGSDRSRDRLRGRLAGADQYLSKPVDSPTLRRVLSRFCLSG